MSSHFIQPWFFSWKTTSRNFFFIKSDVSFHFIQTWRILLHNSKKQKSLGQKSLKRGKVPGPLFYSFLFFFSFLFSSFLILSSISSILSLVNLVLFRTALNRPSSPDSTTRLMSNQEAHQAINAVLAQIFNLDTQTSISALVQVHKFFLLLLNKKF